MSSQQMPPPKPCPFCKSERVELDCPAGESLRIVCTNCRAQGPAATTPLTAAMLWNSLSSIVRAFFRT